MRPNEEIRLIWTGKAQLNAVHAALGLQEAQKFAVEEIDRKSGWRHGWLCMEITDWGGQLSIYGTKARAIVVRFHL